MTSNAAAAAVSCVECQRRKQKVKIRSGPEDPHRHETVVVLDGGLWLTTQPSATASFPATTA